MPIFVALVGTILCTLERNRSATVTSCLAITPALHILLDLLSSSFLNSSDPSSFVLVSLSLKFR